MSVQRIEALIEAAQNAVDAELDLRAAYEWKREAVEYLMTHLGPEHYYTQYFTEYMKEIEQRNLLTGGGVLTAAKEEIARQNAAEDLIGESTATHR
jgi:hypothetical protein